ncbi:MAG: 4-hydroxy-tetrahydrodipicolinate reductase [Ruminococcus sp.]
MTKIIISGCSGKMGHFIVKTIEERNDCVVACGVDAYDCGDYDFTVYKSFDEINEKYDAIIDFSNPVVLDSLLDYAVTKGVPAVICTTGYSEDQVAEIKNASEKIGIFYSGNMSLGINLMVELCKMATKVFASHGDNFDIEVIEKHHNLKLDAPSGTALMIADGISEVSPTEKQYVYDRHSYRKQREKNEIGIHSIRGGTIVGEHEVIFAGKDEVVSIKHEAHSKEVFAVGSVNAAVFMKDKPAGMYDMSDLLSE